MTQERNRDDFSEVSNLLYNFALKNIRASGTLPVLSQGTPEWQAWRAWRVEHKEPVHWMDRTEKFTVPCTWPPPSLEALKADISSTKTRFQT